MIAWLTKCVSPRYFYQWSGRLFPWIGILCMAFFTYGIIGALVLAPPDYQQGEGFRIIYIHVPSAFLSLFVYLFMAAMAIMALIWRIKLAEIVMTASASLGAWFTLLALITGSLWGKPMWGTWWIWDARLTSELILLFLYLGVIALQAAIAGRQRAARASCMLVIVGVVNIPIIHYSVYWWNTLHQGATLSKFAKPSIEASMLYPLLAMIVAFFLYYLTALCLRCRYAILQRESKTQWVHALNNVNGAFPS